MKPFCCSTAQASSRVTVFMRSRMSSGTFGRPSGKRSPCHSGVYLITSSGVKNPCCAAALGPIAAKKTADRAKIHASLVLFIVLDSNGVGLCSIRLKPACFRNLGLLRGFLVHFKPQARFVGRRDVTLLNDLAFLNPVLPEVGMIDPVPF